MQNQLALIRWITENCCQMVAKGECDASKPSVFKAFRLPENHSHSTQLKQIRLVNIASPISILIDTSAYLDYSAY